MENRDLRACPFCGGKGKVSKALFTATIVCDKCGARTRVVEVSVEISALEEAKRLWNRRITDDRAERPYRKTR